jgi:hypothetical protein
MGELDQVDILAGDLSRSGRCHLLRRPGTGCTQLCRAGREMFHDLGAAAVISPIVA